MPSSHVSAAQECGRVTLCPDTRSYAVTQDFLCSRLCALGVSVPVQRRILVVHDEIWSNLVRHSGADQAALCLRQERGTLLLEYTDNGQPYDPTAAAEPDLTREAAGRPLGGLGVYIARKLTASMTYTRDGAWNRLTLCFALGPHTGPDSAPD